MRLLILTVHLSRHIEFNIRMVLMANFFNAAKYRSLATICLFANFITPYHEDGKLRKIREVKLSTPKEKSTLLLQYYPNGEIKKATQKLFGKGTKTFEMEYVDDGSLVYGVYYVDPVKEWKVDLDFFGLAFHPIKSMKQTAGDAVSTYRYQYQNSDGDTLPDVALLRVHCQTLAKLFSTI